MKTKIRMPRGSSSQRRHSPPCGSQADFIIISTHGYTGVKHALLGSTTERVVRHAPCVVLVVRQQEHEFV